MDSLPSLAKKRLMLPQIGSDFRDFTASTAIVFSQFQRAIRAIQLKHRLASFTDYMHVLRAMIVEINRNAVSGKAKYGRQ
jgi:hypothetical protein